MPTQGFKGAPRRPARPDRIHDALDVDLGGPAGGGGPGDDDVVSRPVVWGAADQVDDVHHDLDDDVIGTDRFDTDVPGKVVLDRAVIDASSFGGGDVSAESGTVDDAISFGANLVRAAVVGGGRFVENFGSHLAAGAAEFIDDTLGGGGSDSSGDEGGGDTGDDTGDDGTGGGDGGDGSDGGDGGGD